MSREAMQMALEALESDPVSHAGLVNRKQAITALREALEEKREPLFWTVATGWVYEDDTSENHVDEIAKAEHDKNYERGFVDGMQHQMKSSVDRAINKMIINPKKERNE